MLTQQRKAHILAVLKDTGQVVAKTLSEQLNLSEDTIRRDLRELAAEGLLQRVHGGALPASPATTAVQLVRHLQPGLEATIVTHSPSIAVELVAHPGMTVEMIGGRLFKHSVVAVGASAIESIARFRADIYFMGVTGIHPEIGLTTGDSEEAVIKRALSRHAAETIVLASSEKLGAASPYVILPMNEAQGLVVERSTAEETIAAYRKAGMTVTKA
jgi:DeoR/GlpR family transcriptional regulator of sugar metabolism